MKLLNDNLIQLIDILNDRKCHDGDSLGNHFNLSRAAICKIIKKLVNYGIDIQSIKGKGYQLNENLTLIDPSKIKKHLSTAIKKNVDITVFETIDSTNDYLKQQPNNNKLFNVCIAEQQTKGKGRLGRTWHSPFGENIYLSACSHFQKDVSELAGLSLVISLAVLNTLQKFTLNETLFVKWPNDIIWNAKKLAGTLIEINAETNGTSHAIIGIGINVNMIKTSEKISQPWTSMQHINQIDFDRNQIITELLKQLFETLEQFKQNGLKPFIHAWNQHGCLINKEITLTNGASTVTGKAIGINELGHLILQLPNGKKQAFSSGDTSISKNNS